MAMDTIGYRKNGRNLEKHRLTIMILLYFI